jgi:glyoxylase-like metal-dependent hydrolase (beta-lactamase superfamily II)
MAIGGTIKVHTLPGYIQSMYLVEYPDKLMLMDSGCRCDVTVVKNFIERELKRPFTDLKLVVVTHAHPDHYGGAHLFKKHYNIPVAAADGINCWYRGISGKIVYAVDILLTYLVAIKSGKKIKNIFYPTKMNLDFELKDEEKISNFEDWKVLLTPGHTGLDVTIYHEKESMAYIADNMVKSKNNIYRPYPIVFPEKYKLSLKKYLDLKIENFMMAHYGIQQIPHERIQDLIDTAPDVPRVHSNTLPTILKTMVKAIIKSRK